MFSQYSWWDFIKFVLVLAVPYYAFVLWKYYREDIREWISNRGQSTPPQPVVEEDEEEQSSSALFTVNNYDDEPVVAASQSAQQPKPVEWLSDVKPKTAATSTAQKAHTEEPPRDEVDLQGPAVSEPSGIGFSLPVLILAENPQEISLDVIINAAGRIAPDEQGVYEAIVVDDEPAARIAQVINQQKGTPLDTFAFTR